MRPGPTGLYGIDKDGRIAVAGGPVPRGFHPAVTEAEAWLEKHEKRSA